MPIIGLNIGEHGFRAVEIDKVKDNYQINNFGSFENPQLSKSKLSLNKDLYVNSLKEFLSEFNFSTPNVILGISDSDVFMRVITLPNMSDSDLDKTIKFESEKYIPLPSDQVNVTYQKVQNITGEKDKLKVQLIAARKDKLRDYVDIVKKANLVPYAIEPETLAVSRALIPHSDPSGSIIIDIGFSSSVVIVSYNNVVYFTRTIPFGGDHITRALKEKLDIEYNQAEEYKKTYGIDTSYFDGKLYEIVKPVIDNIVLELRRALLFFSKQNSQVAIKKAIITGGSSMLPGFLEYLIGSLDIEVMLGEPLKNLTLNSKLDKRKSLLINSANLYTTSIGLSMKI